MDRRLDRVSSESCRGLAELAEDGLVLWRVSRGSRNFWCLVFDLPDGFRLVLDSDPMGDEPSALVEHHCDIVALVDRSIFWRVAFLSRGWTENDID